MKGREKILGKKINRIENNRKERTSSRTERAGRNSASRRYRRSPAEKARYRGAHCASALPALFIVTVTLPRGPSRSNFRKFRSLVGNGGPRRPGRAPNERRSPKRARKRRMAAPLFRRREGPGKWRKNPSFPPDFLVRPPQLPISCHFLRSSECCHLMVRRSEGPAFSRSNRFGFIVSRMYINSARQRPGRINIRVNRPDYR